MIVDFDDFREGEHRLDLLTALRDANPRFRCTLFAIPGRGTDRFWESVPDFCELAVHGYLHPTSTEAADWSRPMTEWVLDGVHPRFVRGFKAPGWQISNDTLDVLAERGYWVADQPYNDWRRPEGIRVHRLGDGDHWHGHIPDVCGNGIAETFDDLLLAVAAADRFEFVSEVAVAWVREPVAAKLNFACGPTTWDGFENSDIQGGDRQVDLAVIPYPYEDESADLILMSHALWMTSDGVQPVHPDPKPILREFHRILRPTGWVRVDDNPWRCYTAASVLDLNEQHAAFPDELRLPRAEFIRMFYDVGFAHVDEVDPAVTGIMADEETTAAILGNGSNHVSFAVEARK